MRHAGRIVAEVLALVEESLKPGITTAELDALAEAHIRKAGGRPSFKGYLGYPASICISIDEEVVHGIPGSRVIEDGQVVSVDAGAIWQGYHGDGARTFFVGTPSPEVAGLIAATRLSLMAGIAAAVPGAHMEDISGAVEDVASEGGYGIVRQYVGHGIGTEMHEDPPCSQPAPACSMGKSIKPVVRLPPDFIYHISQQVEGFFLIGPYDKLPQHIRFFTESPSDHV